MSSVLHHDFSEQWPRDDRAFPIPRHKDAQPLSKRTLTSAQVNGRSVRISKSTIMSGDRQRWFWWPILTLKIWRLQKAQGS